MKLSKLFLAVMLFVLTSCLGKEDNKSSDGSQISAPTAYNSSLNAIPQSVSSYKLVRLDGATTVDGTEEGPVLICTPKMEFCSQTCLSVYLPQYERWSVFKTDYLSGGKCVGFAMAYPNGIDIPKIRYWVGNFVYNSGQVTGHCSINVNSPDFDGRAYFDFVRPTNSQTYYLHSFYDFSSNLVGSTRLLSYNPPAMWSYQDFTVTNATITPQLTNWSCVKESSIGSAFQ